MDEIKKRLKENHLVSFFNRAKGCSEEEVCRLESFLNKKLPNVYRNFLLNFGHGMGLLLKGTDFEYKYLIDNQDEEIKNELLDEAGIEPNRLEHVFVFMVHQGYITYFFYCDEGDNPKIYRHYEGDDDVKEIAPSFLAFLNNAIDADVVDRKRG